MADSLQVVHKDSFFYVLLKGVIDVLERAAAAVSVIGARRFYAVFRRGEYFFHLPPQDPPGFFIDAEGYLLARQDIIQEYDPFVAAYQSPTTVGDFFNGCYFHTF